MIFALAPEDPKKLGGPAAIAGSACSRSESPTPALPSRLTKISSSKTKNCLSFWPVWNAEAPPPAFLQALWR